MSGPRGQSFPFQPVRNQIVRSVCGMAITAEGELLARWAERRKTPNDESCGATVSPGLRPSLNELLAHRADIVPVTRS